MKSLAMKQTGGRLQIPSQKSGADIIGQSIADLCQTSQGCTARWFCNGNCARWLFLAVANAGGVLKRVVDAEILAQTMDGGHFGSKRQMENIKDQVSKV